MKFLTDVNQLRKSFCAKVSELCSSFVKGLATLSSKTITFGAVYCIIGVSMTQNIAWGLSVGLVLSIAAGAFDVCKVRAFQAVAKAYRERDFWPGITAACIGVICLTISILTAISFHVEGIAERTAEKTTVHDKHVRLQGLYDTAQKDREAARGLMSTYQANMAAEANSSPKCAPSCFGDKYDTWEAKYNDARQTYITAADIAASARSRLDKTKTPVKPDVAFAFLGSVIGSGADDAQLTYAFIIIGAIEFISAFGLLIAGFLFREEKKEPKAMRTLKNITKLPARRCLTVEDLEREKPFADYEAQGKTPPIELLIEDAKHVIKVCDGINDEFHHKNFCARWPVSKSHVSTVLKRMDNEKLINREEKTGKLTRIAACF